jgi:hypothetical protein
MRSRKRNRVVFTKLIVENYNGKIQLQSEVGKEQR